MPELFFFDVSKLSGQRTRLNDIPLISNEESVIEALKNLFNTRPGERLWDPEFGLDLDRFLFEPLDLWTAERISSAIKTAINKYEPRVISTDVKITLNYDDLFYDIDVYFKIATSSRDISLNFQLEQVR